MFSAKFHTHKETVRTHRCPIGLVHQTLPFLLCLLFHTDIGFSTDGEVTQVSRLKEIVNGFRVVDLRGHIGGGIISIKAIAFRSPSMTL